MKKTLIKGGTIVPMDGAARSVEGKSLLVEGDRIAAIDDAAALEGRGAVDEIIDASHRAILPGFINNHAHLAPTGLFRGVAEDLEVAEYIAFAIPVLDRLTAEDAEVFALLGAVEMLKSGNTCANELGPMMDATGRAVAACGLRTILAEDIHDVEDYSSYLSGWDRFDERVGRERMDAALHVLERWHGAAGGTITCRLANFSPLMCTPRLLEETRALADRHGVGINVHVLTNQGGADMARRVYGKDMMLFLRDIGYLKADVALVHFCYPTDEEIATVSESGAGIVLCSLTDGKAALCPPYRRLIEAGLPLSLGGDWIMMDPWEQLRTTLVMARVSSGSVATLSAYDVLEMMTIGAARVIGREDELGSLEVGKKADLVIIDLDQPHLAPLTPHYDVVKTLVHNACGRDTSLVMVNGRVVVSGGSVITVDEDDVIAAANARAGVALERPGRTAAG